LSLIFSNELTAQVIIKEKVEINPKSTISTYQLPAYTPCGPWITSYDKNNPWQVVWNSISFAPDPYQQLFNFQNNRYGPGLQRRNYILDPNKYYNITLLQPDEYSYFTYGGFWDSNAGNYVPMQYVGTTLSGVLGSDIGATAWFDYSIDPPNGLYHNYSKYTMIIKRDVPPGTEIIMSVFDGQETINYHTRVETPNFIIENDTKEDTLYHNQSRDIEFLINFQRSCQIGNYGGAYPTGIKFNVEIVQGQQYGNLYYPGTVANPEQTGSSITNLEDEYGGGICNYVIRYTADGVQPDTSTPGIVTIRCTANDADIAPAEVSFPIKYSEKPPPSIGGYILVDFNKDSFSPGDTAVANCKWLTAYNEIIDFPGDQSFNAEIVSGKEYGILLDPNTGTVANNLQGVSNGFKVITPTSIPYDSVVIRIKVTTIASGGGITAAKIVNSQNQNSGKKQSKEADINKSTQSMSSTLFIGNPGMLIEGFGDVVVKKPNEILLGETKYYQARYVDGKLVIDELSGPNLWNGGLDEDVWGNNPVTIVEGDKLGVYWEKEKPVWGKNKNSPKGLIRLVGRYWEEGKTYKVRLTARTQNGDQAFVEIVVKKPNKLGPDKPLNIIYTDFVDVFGQTQNINEYCITESGKEGVPPQLPKAQAFKETKFNPQYRYEPWKDIEFHKRPDKKKKFFNTVNTFVVTEFNMGSGKHLPTNHINLPGANYFYTPTKAMDIISRDIRTRYWVTKDYRCVNNQEVKENDIGGGRDITNEFWKFYSRNPNRNKKEETRAINNAIDSVKQSLTSGKLNRYDFIAQSRIVASYNPFQQTYFNAVGWSLYEFRFTEENYSPEMLNEPEHQFKTYVSRIKYVFNKINIEFDGNNWELGYEGSWEAYEKTYNPGENTYHIVVMEYYKLFEPRKEN